MVARQVEKLRDRSGQALAEFAVLIPFFLLLAVGVYEFGAAFQTHQVMTNVAREGARVSVLRDSSDADVREVVRNRLLASGLDPERALVSLRCDGEDGGLCAGADRAGRKSGVGVAYPYEFVLFAGVSRLANRDGDAPGVIELRASTSMMNH